MNLRIETENLRAEAVKLRTALDEQGQKIVHLKDNLAVKDDELDRLKPQMEHIPQMWEELRSLCGVNSQIKKELENLKSANAKLKEELCLFLCRPSASSSRSRSGAVSLSVRGEPYTPKHVESG